MSLREDEELTLQEAAKLANVSYHTIRGAATRFLSETSDSGSILECWRSKFRCPGGQVIVTKESHVKYWLKNRTRRGEYDRKTVNKDK